jgi:hypothetical protein
LVLNVESSHVATAAVRRRSSSQHQGTWDIRVHPECFVRRKLVSNIL